MRINIHHHHHTTVSLDKGTATTLRLILANTEQLKGNQKRMEEKLDQANAELDQLEAAEQNLETIIRAAIDTLVAETTLQAQLNQQIADLLAQQANGTAIMPSTVAAVNVRIQSSITRTQAAAAALKAALPPPAEVPVAEAASATPTDSSTGTVVDPAGNPPASDTPVPDEPVAEAASTT